MSSEKKKPVEEKPAEPKKVEPKVPKKSDIIDQVEYEDRTVYVTKNGQKVIIPK